MRLVPPIFIYSILAVSPYVAAFSNGGGSLTSKATRLMKKNVQYPQYYSNSRSSLQMVATKTDNNPFGTILDLFNPSASTANTASTSDEQVVRSFLSSLNSRTPPSELLQYFNEDVTYIDTSYYNPIIGHDALLKHWLVHAGSSPLSSFNLDSVTQQKIAIDDIVSTSKKVCVMYHLTNKEGDDIPDTTAISFYNLSNGKISQVFDVTEPKSPKPGDSGLRLLKSVSKFIGDEKLSGTTTIEQEQQQQEQVSSAVEQYFNAWTCGDMKTAASLFSKDCKMRDLQYDTPFSGREEFEKHLLNVKDCLPNTFNFVVDDIITTKQKAGVLWHVENNEDPLAFTRGCSFYTMNNEGLIQSGFEIPEKAPPKMGYINTVLSKFEAEPARIIPAILWVAYCYTLFIADGILPGVNALALEQRTWEEVRDLSLNFFLVAPLLKLPFSPVVHPMLEGVFNLLLAWAAMFAGFLSDERKDKPNLLPFGPILIGMQFLTSGFLLPYLITRSVETSTQAYEEDIDGDLQRLVGEWRPLGLFLGSVGTASISWGFLARQEEFGINFSERYTSFIDLLSIDRVGSSFIVDLVIFAIFQSWFVDDDLKRRGVALDNAELAGLRNAAKYVPFFGLAAYLTLRPSLPTSMREESIE